MTIEEAITELLKLLGYYINTSDITDISNPTAATSMAIEALKREQKALELKPFVRNVNGWDEVVGEISRLSKEADEAK